MDRGVYGSLFELGGLKDGNEGFLGSRKIFDQFRVDFPRRR